MLFNSIEFCIFLPIVFSIYWLLDKQKLKIQNFFLLLASYFFYGWWDWRFLSLILASSTVDFLVGKALAKAETQSKRKFFLGLSLFINLGALGIFKYYNFFVQNFIDAFSFFGKDFDLYRLSIILPVGISFYTFQTLSYTIDIYRKKIEPTKDWMVFFTFVSFFPQLVAGPIERASHLLPQFTKPRIFKYDQAKDGLRQMLWGLFKKIVIADTCAIYVNDIFSNYESYSSGILLLGAFYFTFQIYCDFSGYSDIAIGTAKLFGFDLMRNFAYPYFSRDIAEFWRRWHISLSTWFRDYVYIPLGGSRLSKAKTIRNVFIIFLVSGFWHGANWTFIVWGGLNALYFLPSLLAKKNRQHLGVTAENSWFPSQKEFIGMLTTFSLTVFAWIFFRAENIFHAFAYIAKIAQLDFSNFSMEMAKYLKLIFLVIGWEWLQRDKQHGLEVDQLPVGIRWFLYFFLVWLIFYYYGEEQQFIYFQF
jgi:D-alanyl-lipoteichoic acid acyltransferase DltB (MBOAT superfamily)